MKYDGMAVFCPTLVKAADLMVILHSLGYEWASNKSLLSYTNWSSYTENTVYYFDDGKVSVGPLYHFNENENILIGLDEILGKTPEAIYCGLLEKKE